MFLQSVKSADICMSFSNGNMIRTFFSQYISFYHMASSLGVKYIYNTMQ